MVRLYFYGQRVPERLLPTNVKAKFGQPVILLWERKGVSNIMPLLWFSGGSIIRGVMIDGEQSSNFSGQIVWHVPNGIIYKLKVKLFGAKAIRQRWGGVK